MTEIDPQEQAALDAFRRQVQHAIDAGNGVLTINGQDDILVAPFADAIRDLAPKITHLILTQMQIHAFHDDLGVFENIEELTVDDFFASQDVTLPPTVRGFAKLTQLNISFVDVTLPPEIGGWQNLTKISGTSGGIRLPNHLIGADGQPVTGLVALREIVHGFESTMGDLPGWLDGCHNLRRIYIDGVSSIQHLPSSMSQVELESLVLKNVDYRLEALPAGLRVKRLELDNTAISQIPPDALIGHLTLKRGTLDAVPLPLSDYHFTIENRLGPNETHYINPLFLTFADVVATSNIEVRRAMIEQLGAAWVAEHADLTEIDHDTDAGGPRRLLRVPMQQPEEDIVLLNVHDPSTERAYFLRVPPDISTCDEAAAWVAGFDDPNDYHPLIET
ncbi:MAG: DUF6745 domain-containing protein [Chloroflexota bacterium]